MPLPSRKRKIFLSWTPTSKTSMQKNMIRRKFMDVWMNLSILSVNMSLLPNFLTLFISLIRILFNPSEIRRRPSLGTNSLILGRIISMPTTSTKKRTPTDPSNIKCIPKTKSNSGLRVILLEFAPILFLSYPGIFLIERRDYTLTNLSPILSIILCTKTTKKQMIMEIWYRNKIQAYGPSRNWIFKVKEIPTCLKELHHRRSVMFSLYDPKFYLCPLKMTTNGQGLSVVATCLIVEKINPPPRRVLLQDNQSEPSFSKKSHLHMLIRDRISQKEKFHRLNWIHITNILDFRWIGESHIVGFLNLLNILTALLGPGPAIWTFPKIFLSKFKLLTVFPLQGIPSQYFMVLSLQNLLPHSWTPALQHIITIRVLLLPKFGNKQEGFKEIEIDHVREVWSELGLLSVVKNYKFTARLRAENEMIYNIAFKDMLWFGEIESRIWAFVVNCRISCI